MNVECLGYKQYRNHLQLEESNHREDSRYCVNALLPASIR